MRTIRCPQCQAYMTGRVGQVAPCRMCGIKLRVPWQRPGSTPVTPAPPTPPPARTIRSFRDAELLAAEWLMFLGYGTARITPAGNDGGLDAVAERAVAQVKFQALKVGRPLIQALHGAAVVEGKQGVFFASAGYSPEGVKWADRAGIPLFRFDLQGTPEAANPPAARQLAQVLQGRGAR